MAKRSIDLGLAISGALLEPGEKRSHREIASFCGCHWNYIWLLEQQALKKLRKRLIGGSKRELGDQLMDLFR